MRVVVVGAGLSGLSLAVFLRRLGIDAVVLEQAPSPRADVAPPLTLFANALSCFKAYGVYHAVRGGAGRPETCFGIQNGSRRWLLRLPNRPVRLAALRAADAIPSSTAPLANSTSVVSQRAAEQAKRHMGRVPLRTTVDAHHLREALRRDVPAIRFNARVVDLVPHEGPRGGVHAVLASGGTEWGDVVVGADGVHSTVRRLLYPGEAPASRGDAVQVDGVVEATEEAGWEHPVELWGDRRVLAVTPLHNGGRPRLAFSATLHGSSSVSASSGVASGLLPRGEAPADGATVPSDLLRELLVREFDGFDPALLCLLRRAEAVALADRLEVPIMPRWYNRRAVLLGEAAHGALPSFLNQDASLCVEDAAILATALLDVPLGRDEGFEYAFRQYESVRRDRVERYIRQSRRARRFTATSHTTARDGLLRLLPSVALRLSQHWMSSWSYSAQQLMVDPKIQLELAFR